MSTAKERIVKSKSARTIMERYIDPIYEDSEIACALIEVAGRFYDELETYMADIHKQCSIETSTWGLKYWSDEYNINISPGMSYTEVRRLLNEKRRYVAPPNETNLENYVTSQTGVPCRITQWTGPYKFSVNFFTKEASEPLVYSKAYKAIKESRQAHLCFDIIPTHTAEWVISATRTLTKFYNVMTGEPGLRAGLYPQPINFGHALRDNILIEPGGTTFSNISVFTGLRPTPAQKAGFNESVFNIESQKELNSPVINSESQTFSVVSPFCGEQENE